MTQSSEEARLRAAVLNSYQRRIEAQYGARGTELLRLLGEAITQAYRVLAPELLSEGLTMFATLQPGSRPMATIATAECSSAQLAGRVHAGATLQALGDDRFVLCAEQLDPLGLASGALVYRYQDGDHFVIGGALSKIPQRRPFPSWWSMPTFFEVEDALCAYREQVAMDCDCDILKDEIWHDSDRRWLLANKPEDAMQRSLWRYLRNVLRGAQRVREVDREQPVEGRKPPDIKITFSESNRIALIEVKWMGASVNEKGTAISGFRPDERSANDGAEQLANYLDANLRRASKHQTMGYLVVFDGRRQNVTFSGGLTRQQALFYELRDVTYVPDLAAQRNDFAVPLRFFMRRWSPRCEMRAQTSLLLRRPARRGYSPTVTADRSLTWRWPAIS